MPPQEDYVMNYSSLVIDLGLLYLNFRDACHLPNRDRMMRIFKMFLPIFKGTKNQSKYALELLRFLIQHNSILSECQSHRVFYGLFVNNQGHKQQDVQGGGCLHRRPIMPLKQVNQGHINTHIRADQQMEYKVKKQKKLIKHCYSNKTNKNIVRHTAAVHGVSTIGESFDAATKVIRRAKAHPKLSALMDEKSMVSDIISIKPWSHSANGNLNIFPEV
ncbi:uncharacterized protein LOC124253084 [Haliotis rubra]|uniref:uncharacterized protein LOC124253084 n=1 Tax=Haliotis rubra TaxID=36100 RepID=UPI001EE50CBF|nr:uncharacterized protein LOC124253084 [Haliotis rubra]